MRTLNAPFIAPIPESLISSTVPSSPANETESIDDVIFQATIPAIDADDTITTASDNPITRRIVPHGRRTDRAA
jgi:hypothetical protein